MKENKNRCLFCDKPLNGKQSKFCSYPCGYNYRSGGTPYRARGWYWDDKLNALMKSGEVSRSKPEKKQKAPKIYQPFKSASGYVYIISAENGLHKIGITRDINARMRALEREIPLKMEVVHQFYSENCRKVEKHLHAYYADCRIRYEWFNLSEEQVNEIKAITGIRMDAELGIQQNIPVRSA